MLVFQKFLLFLFALSSLLCVVQCVEEDILSRRKRSVGNIPPNVFGSCQGVETKSFGFIASPNFPHSEYPSNQDCKWKVIAQTGQILKFEFVYMDMENGPRQIGGSCNADWLIIYDGRNESYPMVGGQRYCGYSVQFNAAFSTSNIALIHFISDSSLQGSGFALKYTRVDPPRETFDCSFEATKSICHGWTQSDSDNFDWEFISGHTPSGLNGATGPDFDHTFGTIEGTYAFIEASRKSEGDKAILRSPPVDLSDYPFHCLTFWYHMHGAGTGALYLYQVPEGEEIASSSPILFIQKGPQEEEWLEARIEVLYAENRVQFIFVGERGKLLTGDISIDDISLTNGSCPIKTTTTMATTTTTTTMATTTTTTATTPVSTTTNSSSTTTTVLPQTAPPIIYQPDYSRINFTNLCSNNGYSCKETGFCIPFSYFCDSERDCLHNEDEENCVEIGTGGQNLGSTLCSWGQWGQWSECSRSCGGGSRITERQSINGDPGDPGCEGISLMTENCNSCPCGSWTQWQSWIPCTVTCGGGRQTRSRTCDQQACTTQTCSGPSVQLINCNGQNCPTWGGFTAWTSCRVTCGQGVVTRNRKCIGGKIGDDGCSGNITESRTCAEVDANHPPCPVPLSK